MPRLVVGEPLPTTGQESKPAASTDAALPTPEIAGSVGSIDAVAVGGSLHLLVGVKTETTQAAEPAKASPGVETTHAHNGKSNDKTARPYDLFYSRLDAPFQKWTTPVRVNSPTQVVANLSRGSDAKLAVNGTNLLAVWTLPGNGAMGTGPLTMSRSEDNGKTWTPGAMYGPKTDPAETADTPHGFRFPALTVQGSAIHAVWIDALGESRRLGYTRSMDDGKTWATPTIIDPVICACCPNSLAASPSSVYGLYRNQKPSDMALASSRDGGKGFDVTPSIEKFGWEFEGCPHVGGGIVVLKQSDPARPDALVCSTWSGESDHGGVHITRSVDGGVTWSKPLRISESDTSRTSDIAALDGLRLAVAWDELVGLRKVIYASTSNDGGITWSKPSRLSDVAGEGNSDHPRVATTDGRFVVMWTQADAETSTTLKFRFKDFLPR